MDYWQQILALILAPTAVVGALSFIINRLLTNQFQKEIEIFKTKYSYIHQKRAEVLGELYGLLVETVNQISLLTSRLKFDDGRSLEQQKKDVADAFNKLSDYYRRIQIYVDEDIIKLLDEILRIMRSAYVDYDMATTGNEYHYDKTSADMWNQAWEQISNQLPPLKSTLELRFKKILGVIEE